MNFYVLTLFPELIDTIVNTSITGRAIKKGVLSVSSINIRDFSERADGRIDDYPYGGGAGMMLQAEPVYRAIEAVKEKTGRKNPRVVYMTPQAPVLTQTKAEELAGEEDLILLCGHYEGIDERVLSECVTDYLSIGDYVLTGGELGAAVVIDAVSRFVPGVLPNEDSARFESLQDNLLEYPQYTRPEVWHDKQVPEVLLSGDHEAIKQWRYQRSLERTRERRPDLLEGHYPVTCLAAGGDGAQTLGKRFTDAVSQYGTVINYDIKRRQKETRKFGSHELVIFACTDAAMSEPERFRNVSGNDTLAVILQTNPPAPKSDQIEETDTLLNDEEAWDMAPIRMEMTLMKKGFHVITTNSMDESATERGIADAAIALRKKIQKLSLQNSSH
ncbi:MAG: tRNA (guanosine(37)-N1)-methyltransferase TrmD [Eubacteriales bacterium]|jgi:tRNA (guanine37-N1)-methyltransferase